MNDLLRCNSQIMISVLVIFLLILLSKPEPSNVRDKSAVAVFKDGSIIGHVPINMAPILYQFLRREANKAFVEVKGENVNRGGGYGGLEIPCVYRLYGLLNH